MPASSGNVKGQQLLWTSPSTEYPPPATTVEGMEGDSGWRDVQRGSLEGVWVERGKEGRLGHRIARGDGEEKRDEEDPQSEEEAMLKSWGS